MVALLKIRREDPPEVLAVGDYDKVKKLTDELEARNANRNYSVSYKLRKFKKYYKDYDKRNDQHDYCSCAVDGIYPHYSYCRCTNV